MKFRKKPVVIEAIQFDGTNKFDICFFFKGYGNFDAFFTEDKIEIQTLEGVITASPGDWIIRGVKGEFYPCKNDIFLMTYEPVTE
jgi:hypothetical protein